MSRFGLKIVGAMLLLAVIPLVTSIYLVGQVIQASESVAQGQMHKLAQPLARAAAAYRALFAARKRMFKLQARLLASDAELKAALDLQAGDSGALQRVQRRLGELQQLYDGVGSLRLLDGDGRVLAEVRSKKRYDPGRFRDLRWQEPIGAKGGRFEMVFYTPRAPFRDFRELGQAQRFAVDMGRLRGELENYYRVAFLIMFGAALLVAMGVGLFIARRTTQRLSVLVRATREVAAGNLETQVQLDSRDEVRELGDAFNEMVRELRDSREKIAYLEKIGAWQEIARRLAHEIKNPLTPIQLAVQQLHRKYEGEDPKFKRMLDDAYDIITEEVGGLRRLVSAFSAFAKLPTVQPEPVDLVALIDDFMKSHVELAERATLVWEPPAQGCTVLVDRMLIKHVLVNLVENAIQAGEGVGLQRAICVEIVAQLEPRRRRVALIVSDDGPGMDAETAHRAFDPYYTTKEHGTGLGLAIVKKIVLEHQGSISLRSAPGEGTRFTLRLPLA